MSMEFGLLSDEETSSHSKTIKKVIAQPPMKRQVKGSHQTIAALSHISLAESNGENKQTNVHTRKANLCMIPVLDDARSLVVLGKFLQNTYRCASSMIKYMNPQAKLLCTVYSYDIKRTERSSSPEISDSMQKHCQL